MTEEVVWQRRGLIHVPVVVDDEPKNTCRVCGAVTVLEFCRPCRESVRKREHGTHAGYNQHKRRNEKPCDVCRTAEKAYQGKRYKRGQLSDRDRAWCEKNAVKSSWEQFTRQNRMC